MGNQWTILVSRFLRRWKSGFVPVGSSRFYSAMSVPADLDSPVKLNKLMFSGTRRLFRIDGFSSSLVEHSAQKLVVSETHAQKVVSETHAVSRTVRIFRSSRAW